MKRTRQVVQFGFLGLTLLGVFVLRADCERWCPFGGVEALHAYVTQRTMVCSLGMSNFFILGGVLLMTVLLRRAFCGYVCPIGTICEWLNSLGRRLGIPALAVPERWDRLLGCLKYVVLAAVLWLTWQAGELVFRGYDPCYALLSRHGTDITFWAYVVCGAIVVVSLLTTVPFCRWFCPLAAVLSPLARFGLTRVKRTSDGCRDCGLCAKSCPMHIPVDRLEQVTVARCISCLKCVDACSGRVAGALSWGPPKALGNRWPMAILVTILALCTGGAVAASYIFPLPAFVDVRGTAPAAVATVELKLSELGCRGRANRLLFFLERDDLYEIPGYLKLEVWPGPGAADVRITYDPRRTSELAIKRAITEPYYNVFDNTHETTCMESPFLIDGYDPLAADTLPAADDPAAPPNGQEATSAP